MATPTMMHSIAFTLEEWHKFRIIKARINAEKNSDVSRCMLDFCFRFMPKPGEPMTLDTLVKMTQEVNTDGSHKISSAELHEAVVEMQKEHEAKRLKAKKDAERFAKFSAEDMTDDEDELV